MRNEVKKVAEQNFCAIFIPTVHQPWQAFADENTYVVSKGQSEKCQATTEEQYSDNWFFKENKNNFILQPGPSLRVAQLSAKRHLQLTISPMESGENVFSTSSTG
jgi:hypothetical protein